VQNPGGANAEVDSLLTATLSGSTSAVVSYFMSSQHCFCLQIIFSIVRVSEQSVWPSRFLPFGTNGIFFALHLLAGKIH
jgi:hypothetical protein